MSVGTQGTWHVEASGVHPVHLYIYFDGQTLFLQSPDVPDPPTVDHRPLPSTWTPASAQCTISFGRATLVFEPVDDVQEVDDGDATQAQPRPDENQYDNMPTKRATLESARHDVPARPFKPGAFVTAPDDESTRLQPLEDVKPGEVDGEATRVEPLEALAGVAAPPVAPVRPAAGIPWSRPAQGPPPPDAVGSRPQLPGAGLPPVVPPPQGGPRPIQPPAGGFVAPGNLQFPRGQASPGQAEFSGPPSGLLNVPPPSIRRPDAPETFPQKIKREWAAAPPLRRGLFAALPVGVGLAFWLILAGDPPPPPRAAAPVPSASASARPQAQATTPPAASQAPTAWPPIEPVVPVVPRPPAAPAGATPGATVAAGDAGAANYDRRERQAADFVAMHAYDQAIRIYEQLAVERPQNPAFHEAARILRTKLETGTP